MDEPTNATLEFIKERIAKIQDKILNRLISHYKVLQAPQQRIRIAFEAVKTALWARIYDDYFSLIKRKVRF